MRQKGHSGLEDFCFNSLLVTFLSRWRFFSVTNVIFLSNPNFLQLHSQSARARLLSSLDSLFFYCLFYMAVLTGPPAGKQAIVFCDRLLCVKLCVSVCVCVCISLVHCSSLSKCGLYVCVCVCGGAICAQIRL